MRKLKSFRNHFQFLKDELKDFKRVFINPKKISSSEGDEWAFTEGCLSIPHIHEDVTRPESVTLEYFDENWVKHTETFSDIRARVIQHEYDHLTGTLFTDQMKEQEKLNYVKAEVMNDVFYLKKTSSFTDDDDDED